MSKLVELYRGELIPSRAFADGGIHEAIEHYEDVVAYEILAEELALRDMDGEPLTRENYSELMERSDAYLSEFDENGTEHVSVDLVANHGCLRIEAILCAHCNRVSPTETKKGTFMQSGSTQPA